MNYEDGGRWLHGPLIVKWLKRFIGNEPVPDSLSRRMQDWKRGAACDVYALDGWLIRYGLSPWDIPDEAWRSDAVRGRPTDASQSHSRAA
jgi:hypothetical protein